MKDKKVFLVINFILMGRILISILLSDMLYPKTNNLIESMLIDLSPYLILGFGFLFYKIIIVKYEEIVFKYTSKPISFIIIFPVIFIMIITLLYNKELIINEYNEFLAGSIPFYLPSLVKGIDDSFNWLNGKTFLGYNASVFFTTLFILSVAVIMIICLIYLFYLMYKIIKSSKKANNYKEKIFITICTYLLLVFCISTINLYILYFDKNAFVDFTLSNNSIGAILDSFYFTIKNFIAIGGNEANSSLAKIIVICTTVINIYYFIIFVPMLLSKNEISIVSNSINGQMITNCKFNNDHTERYQMEKMWNEEGKKAVFIGINPSYANGMKEDKTTMNVINYLVDYDYGSIIILNLFTIINVETKLNNEQNATNLEEYKDIFEKTDLIIIGWGCQKNIYIKQKEEAEKILKVYSEKVYTFIDDKNRQAIHPSKISKKIELVKYDFKYLDKVDK